MVKTIQDLQRNTVPISEKYCLTISEASGYFGIGEKKLREISDGDNCPFALWVGSKRLIKRQSMEKYLEKQFSI